VHLPLPSRDALAEVKRQNLDLLLAQTGSALLELGVWLRRTQGVPLLCVNTFHLPSVFDVLLPDRLHASPRFNAFCRDRVIPFAQQQAVRAYNASDGLIVLSEGLAQYWRSAMYTELPQEPIVVRWLFSDEMQVVGFGLGPLSQTPAPDQ
jgi:hypothetical protein